MKARKWSVCTLFTSLSAIHTAMVFILSLFHLLLYCAHIHVHTKNKGNTSAIRKVKHVIKHVFDGLMNFDFHLLMFLFCRDPTCTTILNDQGMYSRSEKQILYGVQLIYMLDSAVVYCGVIPGI